MLTFRNALSSARSKRGKIVWYDPQTGFGLHYSLIAPCCMCMLTNSTSSLLSPAMRKSSVCVTIMMRLFVGRGDNIILHTVRCAARPPPRGAAGLLRTQLFWSPCWLPFISKI
eukprot:SAG31_NODE_685_length_12832_cov_28.355376_9_plen_113_part_00